MASLGEISVELSAVVDESGFTKGQAAMMGFAASATKAGQDASLAFAQVDAAVDKSAQRIADAGGRIRDGYGKFVPSAQLAAEAAGNVGGSLGTLGDVAGRTATTFNSGLTSSFAAFDAAIKPLNEGIGRLGEGLKSVGAGLTVGVTAPLALLGGASLSAAGDIQALEKGFAATYKGSEDLSSSLAKVTELAKLPGLGLEEALQGATNLQAAGFSADLARRSLGAFGNALATVGKGKADLDGVGLALSQIASKGKISAEEIGQLAERVPQIRQAMQAAFGTADTEVLQKLNISATAFVEGVTAELEKLPKVTGGINNAFENFSDAGTISLAKFGASINKAFDIEGVLDKLSSALTGIATAFTSLSPSTQKLIIGFAAAAAAVGPILFGLGAIVAALPAVSAGFALLGTTATAALGPIGIGVAAIAAAAFLIIDNWDALVDYFTDGEGASVFGDLAASITNSVSQITDAFAALNGGGNFSDLISASGILKAVFRDIAVGITAVANVLGGAIGGITKLLSGDLAGAANQAERALLGLIQPLANVLGFQVRLAESTQGATEKFDALALTLPGLAANLAKLATPFAIPAFVTADAVTKQVGLLEALRTKLKQVQDQREAETSEKAIFIDDKEIARIEAEIKRLTQAGAAGQSALQKLREALTNNDNNSRALGSSYDYVGGRIKVLESGITSLIAAGFNPLGRTVQGFVTELRGLATAVDQLSPRIVKGLENIGKPGDFKLELPKIDAVPELLPLDLSNISVDAEGIGAAYDAVLAKQKKFNEDFSAAKIIAINTAIDFNKGLSDILVGGLNGIAAGVGEAIGGIILGTSGLNDIGAAILGPIGDVAIQLGKLAIAVGIGIQGIQASLSSLNPALAIAGGIALIAIGSAIKGAASSIATGSSGGGTGASSSSPSSLYKPATINAQPQIVRVEVVARGRDLAGVVDVELYRRLRTG